MHKLLIVVSTVFAILIGFVLGINSHQLTANALLKSLAFAELEYTIPLTVTMLADISENEQQTVTIPLVIHHTLAVESPDSNVIAIESAAPVYAPAPSATIDNIGIPYTLNNPTDVEVRWLVREFDEMAVFEAIATNMRDDESRVVDSLIIAVTFYDHEGNFLSVSDAQPIPYGEPELPSGDEIHFQVFSYDDAPFADIGSYTIQVEASYGEPERRRSN